MKIALFYSGVPLPAMADIGRIACLRGREVCLIYIDRNLGDLPLDPSIASFPTFRLVFPFNGLDVRRFLLFPWLIAKALIALKRSVRSGDLVITCSLDTLLIANIFSLFRSVRIRHQVRDLHPVQLSHGFKTRFIRWSEKTLLRRCEMLMFSSRGFYDRYYAQIFNGEVVLLENLPRRDIWEGFQRSKNPNGVITIGYIGIARYMQPLVNLIDAVKRLNIEGGRFRVKFAGGGDMASLREFARGDDSFEFHGLFEYTRDIARLHQDIDVIFAVYDKFNSNCQLAMPTKFYESLVSGIPIMVSDSTEVGEQVRIAGTGIAVDGTDVAAISAALADINRDSSWYQSATGKLSENPAGGFYSRFETAIEKVISVEVGKNV